MTQVRLLVTTAMLAMLALVLIWRGQQVWAHEGREVGEYKMEVGWHVEPAYVGVPNGPEVFITRHNADEKHSDEAQADDHHAVEVDEALANAAKTLKLKVIFGNQSRELKLIADSLNPGRFVADLIPTRPGDYTFHLTGKIGDTVIDEKFSSADGEISTIEPASDVFFPDTKLDLVSLQAQIDALKKEIDALKAAKK